MFETIKSAFLKIISFFMMIWTAIFGVNTNDNQTVTDIPVEPDNQTEYVECINSIGLYENTIDTAIPQTEIYNIISEHFTSALPEGKTVKKAIVIGYDGCRADSLSLLDDAHESAFLTMTADGAHTYLSYCGGKNYPETNTQATSTAPGWCSMLCGCWADEHGITDNGIEKSIDCPILLRSLVENGTINGSAFCVSWSGHFSCDGATYLLEKNYCVEKGLNVQFLKADDDNGTYANTLNCVTAADGPDFIFSIFEHCDHAGHSYGFYIQNDTYKNEFYAGDAEAAEIISAIKARATYDTEDWLIILTSDHGGYSTYHGSSSIQERMTFITINKSLSK